MRRFIAAIAISAALASTAFAAEEYKIDPNHSSANFSVRHAGVSTVHGRFSKVTGAITFDEANPANDKVVAVIEAGSITTDNSQRDNHLKSPDFFDVQKYPEIKFESTKVEKRGDQWVAIGNLTIKDVTKQVELPFEMNKATTGPKQVMGVNAETKVNRMDYHVNWNKVPGMVGEDVKIEVNVEASKAGQ